MQTLLDKGCKKQKLRAHSELLVILCCKRMGTNIFTQLDIQVEAQNEEFGGRTITIRLLN